MVNLIKPKESNDSSTAEFYTVEVTGESGMSQSGLSVLCGVTQPAISGLEKTLISRAPSKTLEPFVGKRLTLISSEDTGLSKAREDMPRKGLTASGPLESWVDLGALCLRTQPGSK